MKKSFHYQTRKFHRYLGLVLGVQFLMWTAGGLYFSWSDMDQVHGDHQKKSAALFPAHLAMVSPSVVLAGMRSRHPVDSIAGIQLIQIDGQPVYQISYVNHPDHRQRYQLAKAKR
jgi:hypothetical protein